MSANLTNHLDTVSYRPRIGVLITRTDPYWIQALEAIIHANQKIGDELVMLEPAATLEDLYTISTDELVDQVLAHSLDVLITTVITAPVLEAVLDEGIPVVCLSETEYRHPLFTAMSSLYDGGRMAGEYIGRALGGRGHALCVTAGLEKMHTTGQSRLAGFYDGIKPFPGVDAAHLAAYWSYAQARPHLLTALAGYPKRIDAIFGVSDAVIMAVRDAGQELGVVDDHTILVGLNGDPMALAAIAEGSLSATIDTASEVLGAEAAHLAHNAALGQPLPELMQHRYQLITKDNVASIATRKLTAIADIPTQMVGYSRQQEMARLSQLEISMEITRQIESLLDRNRLVQVIGELVRRYYGYDWTRILRWSDQDSKLEFYGGELSPASQQIPVDQDWLLHQVFLTNEVVFIPDIQTSRRWRAGDEWNAVRSRAVLPIQLGASVIGILDLQSAHPVRQPSLETVGLKLLASQLGIAIQNADLYLDATQARESAERANQLKTRLVANVGHEMRTPLNSILGFSQSIQKKLQAGLSIPSEELQQDIHHIYKSGEHLMFMINDLLDLSRAEIGALTLYFEPLQPASFLKTIFQEFAQSATTSAEVRWNLEVPDQLPVIRVDMVRLRQILINLLSNASKYTSRGTITLGAEIELPFLHIWVRDTGQGVPIELQGKIFEPFGTIERKRRHEGIGLGLSITRRLVALHDGTITLESQPGAGSTFHVYLPLPGVARDPERQPAPGTQPVMLVISSQPCIPAPIEQLCASQKLTPRLVQKREDIVHALAEDVPGAIAWDLAHASSSEWALIYRLSASQACAALPVVLFGGDDEGSQLKTGLTHVVFKSCNTNALKDWISEISTIVESRASILVVDDDPQAREYYRGLLETNHPQRRILLAENGSQALDILQTEVPDLILLDLMMPDVDGFKVLERVRGDIRTQRVPVIIISGKLLNYEDIQRLNYLKTVFYTKGVFSPDETVGFINQIVGETKPLPQPTSMLIKHVLVFLHQNYPQPINRKSVADAVGVSENYLSQIFRQEITISPWDYLNRLRIQKARELLVQSDSSITQIATQVGFNDSAYFSRVFHKLTGQSPLEFRQSSR